MDKLSDDQIIKGMILSQGFDEKVARALLLFSPVMVRERARAYLEKRRFVHYTSASTARKIADTGTIWFRNARMMNDWTDVRHGIDLIDEFLNNEVGISFLDGLDNTHAGVSQKIKKLFDDWKVDLETETYVFCLSEHGKKKQRNDSGEIVDLEDSYGRLSMWRAYGGNSGVAIVLKPDIFHSSTENLNAESFPVFYCTKQLARKTLTDCSINILLQKDFLLTLSEEELVAYVFHMFEYFSVCMKHPSFDEEREWRVVHRPTQKPSPYIKKRVVDVAGVPQRVFEWNLKNMPPELTNFTIPNLIDKIIIGPTEEAWQLRQTLVGVMRDREIEDAEDRVTISNIPLR